MGDGNSEYLSVEVEVAEEDDSTIFPNIHPTCKNMADNNNNNVCVE